MVTYERASTARDALCSSLFEGSPPVWSRGFGVGRDQDGSYFVKVNVGSLTDEVRASLPETVDGVPVVIEEVGDVVAQGPG